MNYKGKYILSLFKIYLQKEKLRIIKSYHLILATYLFLFRYILAYDKNKAYLCGDFLFTQMKGNLEYNQQANTIF